MSFDISLKKELEKGDYRNEAEDAYVKMIEADTKKSLFLRVGMSTFYIILLLASLYIV